MYSMSKNVYTERILDHETGELVTTKWISKTVKSKEHFYRVFLDDLKALNKLSHADYRILHTLATFLEYNTNQFFLNKERRLEIANMAGLADNTVAQAISRLVKKNLLLKVSSFTYQMNPRIFFNGEELERSKILEVVYRYEICADC